MHCDFSSAFTECKSTVLQRSLSCVRNSLVHVPAKDAQALATSANGRAKSRYVRTQHGWTCTCMLGLFAIASTK